MFVRAVSGTCCRKGRGPVSQQAAQALQVADRRSQVPVAQVEVQRAGPSLDMAMQRRGYGVAVSVSAGSAAWSRRDREAAPAAVAGQPHHLHVCMYSMVRPVTSATTKAAEELH